MGEEVTIKNVGLKIDAGAVRLGKVLDELERRIPWYDKNPLSIEGVLELTDLGNAERFAKIYGKVMRYCWPTSTWYIWDNRRWKPDAEGTVRTYAANTVRTIYGEARGVEDKKDRERISKHAVASEKGHSIKAMIELAQSMPCIPVLFESLDADPKKLNILNGTVDLETGILHKHDQKDLITKLAPVKYDPDARSDLWDHFLKVTTGGDKDLERYLAYAVGASLSGSDCGLEKLFYILGSTATGKSTFIEALKATFGEYAVTCEFNTFLAGRRDGIRSDIVRLSGSRFVFSAESEDGRKLAPGLIKQITGGDTIAARPLYRDEIEIKNLGMLWFISNHRATADAGDDAMWRRFNVVPFEHTIPEEAQDPDLKKTLSNPRLSGSAILRWAIDGRLEWIENGKRLIPPECIRVATQEYKAAVNPIGQFIEDCCTIGGLAEFSTTFADLWDAYTTWAETNRIRPVSKTKLGKYLKAFGLTKRRTATERALTWDGIELKTGF